MDAKKQKPFTEFERRFVLNLLHRHAGIIENKKTDAITSQRKAAAWESIVQEFNRSPRVKKMIDAKRIKKFWNNLKSRTREERRLRENLSNFNSGGLAPNMDQEHIMLSIDPNLLPIIKEDHSDTEDNVEGDDEYDPLSWTHVNNHKRKYEETSEFMEDMDDVEQRTNSHSNHEHSDIENLKLQMLKQDLIHRKQKHDLEILHLHSMNELDRKLKESELEHKQKMHRLCEEEIEIKIQLLKNQTAS